MGYRLLLSGHKPTFELFEFDPDSISESGPVRQPKPGPLTTSTGSLRRTSTPEAPPSLTWLERSPTVPNVIYGSSETENEIYSFKVNHEGLRVESKRKTGCSWHVHCTSPSLSSSVSTCDVFRVCLFLQLLFRVTGQNWSLAV